MIYINDKHITVPNLNKRTNNAEKIRMLFLFLIQPFIFLLLSFRNYRKDWAKNALWLFVIFYGLTFAISPHSGSDSVRYAQRLVDMHSAGWDLNLLMYQLYAVDGFRDLYMPLATFLVSRFTDNYNILFGVFGLVLGFFYSRNIWMLIDRVENKMSLCGIMLLLVFAFIVGISDGINGVRMWTGAHVFIYGMFLYFLDNKRYGLIVAASATLFHFSYIVPSLLMLGFLFLGARIIAFYSIFVISFFIKEIDFEVGRQLASFLPEVFREGTTGYLSEAVEMRVTRSGPRQLSWFLVWNSTLFPLAIFVLSSYLSLFKRKKIAELQLHNLLAAGLLFFGVFNILGYYPSVGRFLSPSAMLLFGVFFLYAQNTSDKKFKYLIAITSPALILYLVISIRMLFEYGSYLLFIGNPLISPFLQKDMGFYEFLRQFI